jgi:hypothetical protein
MTTVLAHLENLYTITSGTEVSEDLLLPTAGQTRLSSDASLMMSCFTGISTKIRTSKFSQTAYTSQCAGSRQRQVVLLLTGASRCTDGQPQHFPELLISYGRVEYCGNLMHHLINIQHTPHFAHTIHFPVSHGPHNEGRLFP